MNEDFLKQVIAELVAKQDQDNKQLEAALGTSLIILALAISDQVDIKKLITSIEHGAAIADKHGFLNTTAHQLMLEMLDGLQQKVNATPHLGQAKH